MKDKAKSNSSNYYLVKYYGENYDDYYEVIMFITKSKLKATKYVAKFNRLLEKWKKYYSQFETYEHGCGWVWLKDDCSIDIFNRWDRLRSITKCEYIKVEVR